jgi:hypothetical protein
VTDEEMQALVLKYDTGRDGSLSVAELAKLLEGGAQYSTHGNHRTKASPAKPAKRART